jgi:hypothetical protein
MGLICLNWANELCAAPLGLELNPRNAGYKHVAPLALEFSPAAAPQEWQVFNVTIGNIPLSSGGAPCL